MTTYQFKNQEPVSADLKKLELCTCTVKKGRKFKHGSKVRVERVFRNRWGAETAVVKTDVDADPVYIDATYLADPKPFTAAEQKAAKAEQSARQEDVLIRCKVTGESATGGSVKVTWSGREGNIRVGKGAFSVQKKFKDGSMIAGIPYWLLSKKLDPTELKDLVAKSEKLA